MAEVDRVFAQMLRNSMNDLQIEAFKTSVSKGFWDHELVGGKPNPSIVPEKIALAQSELSEALDALRDPDKDDTDFAEELADCVIRCMDLAQFKKVSLGTAVVDKMNKNLNRPRLHGKTF